MEEKLFNGRIESIVDYCKDKIVLDLGCTQHKMLGKEVNKNNWLHYRINRVAKELVGIDYLKDEVERLNKKGYNIVYGNVEHIDDISLPIKSFDVIVCGELIEHLPNPGLFLKNVRKIMSNSTILIITTPNVYSKERIRLMQNKKYENEWLNKEHKCWFSFETLKQLLKTYNYQEIYWGYHNSSFQHDKSLIKMVKKIINYKHCNQIELENGLYFISKINN